MRSEKQARDASRSIGSDYNDINYNGSKTSDIDRSSLSGFTENDSYMMFESAIGTHENIISNEYNTIDYNEMTDN